MKPRPNGIGRQSDTAQGDIFRNAVVDDRAHRSTVLVIADGGQTYQSVVDDIFRLGKRAITARSPLGAILKLQDETLSIDLVLAPSHDPKFSLLEFFAFVKDEFPHVRRIAYAKSGAHAFSTQGDYHE